MFFLRKESNFRWVESIVKVRIFNIMIEQKLTKKEITDYFRSNIFESILAYSAWKIILGSRSTGMIPADMVERYVKIQKYHPEFFMSVEYSFLFQFVIKVLHSFDFREDSFSLYKINKETTKKFVLENKKIIKSLRDVRNKIFAHRDTEINQETLKKYTIPPMNDLDQFFQNLIDFYNSLTSIVDRSSTVFDNAYDIKNDIENLFMNIERGETIRKKEIDIKWQWSENSKKASDLL